MSTEMTKQTEATLTHHLQAVTEGDMDAILSDYVEESILYTPDGPLRGLNQIRGFFVETLTNAPPGFMENFEMVRQDVEGELAYIVWKSASAVPLGTDTFIVRKGKIVMQTFAAHATSG
jgi:ketosteroid isomerase-like protein